MATDPRHPNPPRHTTAFCATCNARDRIIQHGRCVTCGNDPTTRAVVETQPTRDPRDSDPQWSVFDRYLLGLCVAMTLYLVWQVVRWL